MGRKNYLFSGSHESAQRAAMIYSLLETCKINNINPMEWLHDILLRIDDHPNNQIEAFASTQLDKSLVRNLICTSLDGYDIKWIHLS